MSIKTVMELFELDKEQAIKVIEAFDQEPVDDTEESKEAV